MLNIKQYPLMRAPIALITLLLIILLMKLTSCMDDSFENLGEDLFSSAYSWPATYYGYKPDRLFTFDSMRVDTAAMYTIWSHIEFDSVMVLTGFEVRYYPVGQTFFLERTKVAVMDTIDFRNSNFYGYVIKLGLLENNQVYEICGDAQYLKGKDTVNIIAMCRSFVAQ